MSNSMTTSESDVPLDCVSRPEGAWFRVWSIRVKLGKRAEARAL